MADNRLFRADRGRVSRRHKRDAPSASRGDDRAVREERAERRRERRSMGGSDRRVRWRHNRADLVAGSRVGTQRRARRLFEPERETFRRQAAFCTGADRRNFRRGRFRRDFRRRFYLVGDRSDRSAGPAPERGTNDPGRPAAMKRVMSPGVLKQPPESVENPETAAANALPQSVLTIDIGTVNTRACLFEIRAGKYRFIGSASDRTTHLNHERSEFVGIAAAVRKLEKNVKKRILDADGNFILPMATDFSGIDQAAASYTCIADPAIAIFGLSEAGSLPALRSLCARLGTTPILECALDDGYST